MADRSTKKGWKLVFEDNFDRAEVGENWKVLKGDWQIEKGKLLGKGGELLCTLPFPGGQRMEYEATGGEVLCDLSAFVGANEKGYLEASVFGFGSNNNRLSQITARGKEIAAGEAVIEKGKTYRVSCERDGHRLRLWVDGEVVVDGTCDDPPIGVRHEQIGLYIHGEGAIANVKVYTKPETLEISAEDSRRWVSHYEERFDSDSLGPDWAVTGGDFTLVPGASGRALEGRGELLFLRRFKGDVQLEMEVSSEDPCDLGVVLCTNEQGIRGGYFLSLGADGNYISRMLRFGKEVSIRANVAEAGTVHRIVCARTDALITMEVDGVEVLGYNDSEPLTGPEHEMLGLYFYNRARVEGVKVSVKEGDEPLKVERLPGKPGGKPLDYRWVVVDSGIVYDEHGSHRSHGLVRLEGGDLLLSMPCWLNPTATPGEGEFGVLILRSGDRGRTWTEWSRPELPAPVFGGVKQVLGPCLHPSGRLVMLVWEALTRMSPDHERFISTQSVMHGAYSDDQGKTWKLTAEIDISPFLSVDPEQSKIFVSEGGTAVASFRCHRNQEELDNFNGSVGLIRSRDGGESWGEISMIKEYNPRKPYHWYNESVIQELPDGRWVCFLRCNQKDTRRLSLWRCYSSDKGFTWSEVEHVQGLGKVRFWAGEPMVGCLPDGGLLLAQNCGPEYKRRLPPPQGIRYEVSYDAGLTWAYTDMLYTMEPGSLEHLGTPQFAVLDEETMLVVYHRAGRQVWKTFEEREVSGEIWGGYTKNSIGVSVLKKIPVGL